MWWFLILILAVPLIELWLLIEIGKLIGSGWTVLLVLATGFAGVLLARSEGTYVLYRMQRDLEEGIVPADKLFDGAAILIGGLLLITPGFLTDAAGFLLLFPGTRLLIKLALQKYVKERMEKGTISIRWR